MYRAPLPLVLSVALTLAGCAAPVAPVAAVGAVMDTPGAAVPVTLTVPTKTVRAIGRLAVHPAVVRRTLMRTVEPPAAPTSEAILPFAKANLARVDVFLWSAPLNASPTLVAVHQLTADQFDTPLDFSNLLPDAPYRLTVKAFQAADGNTPDVLVEAQDDAGSVTNFSTVANEIIDLDALGGIQLTLLDRVFHGEAPGAITLTEGVLESTTSPEGIAQ